MIGARISRFNDRLAQRWSRLGPDFLPFADAASSSLPLRQLLRLSLFQISVGMATTLLTGTLNRVMIVELSVPTWLVATMVSLPLLFAPFRALIGFRSDNHRSILGWRRVPYIWMGTLLQFGGLAIMPFALIILSGDTHGPVVIGHVAAALAFLLVGVGLHTTQTAGLALATDLAPKEARPRVVALLYVMLLVGMAGSALVFGALLRDFSQIRLIQVIQGTALLTMIFNLVALWQQEPRNSTWMLAEERPGFRATWQQFAGAPGARRLLWAVGLGTAAFTMQDILLEPYGGEILGLGVSATTVLTALTATGALAAFVLAARRLAAGGDAHRLAASGALVGLGAFAAVIFAAPLASDLLFRVGAVMIGFGGGLFAVGTLTAAMGLDHLGNHGLALGAWGAVQATVAGLSILVGGGIQDFVSHLAATGRLGVAMSGPSVGYSVVYHLEILLLFATLVAIGPLVGTTARSRETPQSKFGLAQFPS